VASSSRVYSRGHELLLALQMLENADATFLPNIR
jgi:hypothetical protein